MKLQGIRVLDMSRFLPGPYVSMMMADHGAEVIKIESAEGEPTRGLGPLVSGQTAYFRNTQRGKKSCALDLKSPEGHQDFLELVSISDVVIESFRPGVVAKLGIDYQSVRARAPRIVYCSLSAFGQTGALAARPSQRSRRTSHFRDIEPRRLPGPEAGDAFATDGRYSAGANSLVGHSHGSTSKGTIWPR
jgi:crotonobetainyl-CoA:carnitine CoA-transferase CaiB-like acyl-CoA transferase